MTSKWKSAGNVIAWIFAVAVLAAVTLLFWAYIGIILAVVVPVAIILSVLRSLVNELRGRGHSRPEYGSFDLSHIPEKSKKIRHFTTPGTQHDHDDPR